MNRGAYIDVRGIYPIYTNGMITYTLPWTARNWSVADVERYLQIQPL